MAIDKKTCKCGCGRTFLGTARRRFYCDYCRVVWNRAKRKMEKKNEQQTTKIKIKIEKGKCKEELLEKVAQMACEIFSGKNKVKVKKV